MNTSKAHILVVDDDIVNVEIITEYLEDSDYKLSTAEDGEIALEMLEATPEDFDIVLLDRMMPNVDGLTVLKRIKAHNILKNCPVIMQTARAAREDILEGMQAGAYYYLTKPFEEELLFSVVKTAVEDRARYKQMHVELHEGKKLSSMMSGGSFRISKIVEARSLSTFLAQACPSPETVIVGLTELMINAVEHGNLGISYDDKTRLNSEGSWEDEVNRRLEMDQYRDKYAEIGFKRNGKTIEVTIVDQGDGFDWNNYLVMNPERAMDNHGRGIAIAGAISFSKLEYRGKGNEVCAYIDIPAATEAA